MLHLFRTRLRPIAIVALLSLAGLGGLSPAMHDIAGCHEPECFTALARHDPSSHAIRPAQAEAEHALHCVLCQWTRTLRPSIETVYAISRPAVRDVRVPADAADILRQVLEAQPSLRSPPTSFVA